MSPEDTVLSERITRGRISMVWPYKGNTEKNDSKKEIKIKI
jgi:hypothetical protein